jgi:hypothetical protein
VKIFGRKAAKIAQVAATGVAGTATVTAIEQTGVMVNDNPRCRVRFNITIPGQPVYQHVKTRIMPPAVIARFQPGCAFPVRVDPDDLTSVVVIDSTDFIYASGAAVLATGQPGTATVRKIFENPQVAGMDIPAWELALRVQADDGRPPYDLRLGTDYPAELGRPRKGDRLAVRIDPDDPRRVAFDWAVSSPRRSEFGNSGGR